MLAFKSYCYDDNVIINRLTSALRSEQEAKYLTNKSEEEYNTIKTRLQAKHAVEVI